MLFKNSYSKIFNIYKFITCKNFWFYILYNPFSTFFKLNSHKNLKNYKYQYIENRNLINYQYNCQNWHINSNFQLSFNILLICVLKKFKNERIS